VAAAVVDSFEVSCGTRSVAGASSGRTASLPPAPVRTGTFDYYRQRHDDFARRNPGLPAPSYYLEYGDKYAERFSRLGQDTLTPEGLAWRDRTLVRLQEKMEALRVEDPEAFARLERDDAAFTRFAYQTHPQAYVESGLYDLPVQDLLAILATPDLDDILTPLGTAQILDALKMLRPSDMDDILVATGKEAVRDAAREVGEAGSIIARGVGRVLGGLRDRIEWF